MSFFDSVYGAFATWPGYLVALSVFGTIAFLGFHGAPLWIWLATTFACLFLAGAPWWVFVLVAPGAAVLGIPALRRAVITRHVMRLIKSLGFLPVISETEQVAISAGTVWLDGELFSGKPDFKTLNQAAYPDLTAEEQTFLAGPVEAACKMTDPWQVQLDRDLSTEVWDFLKREKFLGMIIPKKYGGLGLSPSANSAVVAKLTSRSMPLAITVMVPNSLGVPFYNCPTSGRDVVVPLDAIIGGAEGAGKGWLMLMECLSAGRGISLPACANGGAKMVSRYVGGYAAVRKQFGLPIGRFEGIEEPIARIAGFNYVIEAARRYTNGGLDSGAKPAVVTAIMKYNTTEMWRTIVNDAMDVVGGAGISRGPRNVLASAYAASPICITVEGANILTRTLMIFGQGAIRCHPYSYKEIEALTSNDLPAFDHAFIGHMGHVGRNTFRAGLLSLSRGWLAAPPTGGVAGKYWRKLSWASSSFALFADMAMGTLGGDLKRKEKLTGRFADVFSWLYLGTATLRRFEADGRREEDIALVEWSMEHCLAEMQRAFSGLLQNMKLPVVGVVAMPMFRMWNRVNPFGSGPTDRQGAAAARTLLVPGAQRDRLTEGMHVPTEANEALARIDRAMELCADAEQILRKIKQGMKDGKVPAGRPERKVAEAEAAQVISADERKAVETAEAARRDAIAVDSFTLEEYANGRGNSAPQPGQTPEDAEVVS